MSISQLSRHHSVVGKGLVGPVTGLCRGDILISHNISYRYGFPLRIYSTPLATADSCLVLELQLGHTY